MSPFPDSRPCPLCDQRQAQKIWEKQSVTVVRCGGCSMAYADPVAEELKSGWFYEHRSYYLSPEKLDSDYAPVRFQRELRLFRRWCASGRVLDVGCSTGAFLYQLKTRYAGIYQVLGIDTAGSALDYAESRGVPVCRQGFLEGKLDQERFHAVTFWAVLEHLVEPKKFLAKAAEVLEPGGDCFILTPDLRSLAVRLVGGKYR